MEHKIITIFYLIDEYLRIMKIKDDVRAKVSYLSTLSLSPSF